MTNDIDDRTVAKNRRRDKLDRKSRDRQSFDDGDYNISSNQAAADAKMAEMKKKIGW